MLFLFCAFRSGSDRYYLKKAAGFRADGRDVLHYISLKNAVALIRFNLCLFAVKLSLLLFFFAPAAVCLWVLFNMVRQGSVSLSLFSITAFTAVLLLAHGTVFFLRFNSFLFTARYCFVTGNFNSLKTLFLFSRRCMEQNRKRVLIKKLSFIPWFITCIFLLPIGFVRSYYHQSMADIAADLIEKHLQKA